MKFDVEICDGISCPECPFNRIGGCLLAKRLDEIEIIKEPSAQPVDAVEVVRCICCKYYGEDIFDRCGYCKKHKLDCDDFDFCSRGEKK